MNKNPLISIALCTYNGSSYLKEQIDSILKQTYTNFEVIIVDDKSTDNTKAIANRYVLIDSRIQFFENDTNLGFNQNFEKACKLCNGDFIAISDQDDIWDNTKLEKLLVILLEKPNTIMVHCLSTYFIKGQKQQKVRHNLVNLFFGNNTAKLFLFNPISGHNMLFKKQLLQKALPFPKNIYYDWWLAVNATVIGEVEVLKCSLVMHRVHQQNASKAQKKIIPFYEQTQINLTAFEKIDGLKKKYKNILQKLLHEYKKYPRTTFSFKLFLIVFKHASILFAHKKRKFTLPSYIKHALKATKASTKN